MKKTVTAAGVALLIVSMAGPVSAQSRESADRVLLDMAQCMVNGRPAEARALIAMNPFTKEANEAQERFTDGRDACMRATTGSRGGKLNADYLSTRAAIARQLYLREVKVAPAETSVNTSAPFTGSGKAQLVSHDVARCAAMRDPVAADMLIRAGLRSDAEKVALQRLMPVISSCTPTGARLGFKGDTLRGHLAEALLTARATGA
jgi:hypothetical protein